MHREIRALRAEYTKPGGIVPTRLAEPIGNVIAAYDRRPKFTTLTDDGIQQLRIARRRAMDSGDIELLTHVVDQITGGVLPVSPVEQNVSYGFSPPSDFKVRKVASIIVPGYDNDGVQLYPELRAIRLELASLFGQVIAWEGAMMLRDSRAMTQCECTRFEVEIVDAPGENDLRRVAARAARSFRQPDGIAIRLPDGSTYRIDAEGVAR